MAAKKKAVKESTEKGTTARKAPAVKETAGAAKSVKKAVKAKKAAMKIPEKKQTASAPEQKKNAAVKKAAAKTAVAEKAEVKTAATEKKKPGRKPALKKVEAPAVEVKKPAVKAMPKKPTAIVTGAAGFAGGHMVDLLIERGYKVIATDLESAPREYLHPEASFIPADITSMESLKRLFKDPVDYVYHPAAIFDYEAPWELCERVNVFGMRNMCEHALHSGAKRFLLFSTVSVYGYPEPDELPVKEDNAKRPGTNYERSKLMQEEVGMEYNERGLPVTVVRPAPVYGPRNFYGFATILFLIAKFPIMPFPINLDSYMVGVHVRDVCNAAMYLAKHEGAVGECYNINDNSRYTMREFVEFVAPLLGVHLLPVFIPKELLFKLGNSVADFSKSVSKFAGTRPFIEKDMVYYLKAVYTFCNDKLRATGYELLYPDMLEGMRETTEWYKDNGYLDRIDLWKKALFSKTR